MLKVKRFGAIMLTIIIMLTFSGCSKSSVATRGQVEKKLQLTVWTTQGTDYVKPQMPEKLEDRLVEQWLVNKTGVQVTNMYGNGGGQWEAKLGQLVAGNNMPNLIHCGGGQGPGHFAKLTEGNLIWELTPELLEKYAPDIWRKVPKTMWDRMTVNGKILGIPYDFPISKEIDPKLSDEIVELKGSPKMDFISTLWIRDDVLKKIYPNAMTYNDILNLYEKTKPYIGDELFDVPITTTEEYVKFMYDIKKLNITEGNKPVFATGYNGADNWFALSYLGASMMGINHSYTGSWDAQKQKMRIPLFEAAYKEAALIQNRMVRDNVIDPESLVHTNAQWKTKVMNGQYAIIPMNFVGDPQSINQQLETSGKTFRFRPFYTKVATKAGYEAFVEPLSWNNSVGILKTINKKELLQVLKWMNTMFTDEYDDVRLWGPKDAELYVDTANGERKFKDENYEKFFIGSDNSALKQTENKLSTGLFTIKFMPVNNNVKEYKIDKNAIKFVGARFKLDNPHIKNLSPYPPCQMWSAEFASIDLVKSFWAQRSQWEDTFKKAYIAKSDQEFSEIWDASIKNAYTLVDVDAMLNQMTSVAKQLAK